MLGLINLSLVVLAVLPALVKGHANVTSPPIRGPGQALVAACGQASFDSISSDPTGHIEEQTPFLPDCKPTLCRGMLLADQPSANIQQVTPGQAMSMQLACTIPHGGPANVTLLDTTGGGDGEVIGGKLAEFTDFCPLSGVTPADQTNLQFTLPSATDVGTKCQKAGDCVVQLFWATPDLSQNYYYCVDVTMAAAAAASSAASSPAAQSTAQTSAQASRMQTSTAAGPQTTAVSAAQNSVVPSSPNSATGYGKPGIWTALLAVASLCLGVSWGL